MDLDEPLGATVPLKPGANPLTFFGFDRYGTVVASDTITVTSSAVLPDPMFVRGDVNPTDRSTSPTW